jgi:hypothetical protein
VAEEEGKVDLRCCGRSRFRTWLIVYRDRRRKGGLEGTWMKNDHARMSATG